MILSYQSTLLRCQGQTHQNQSILRLHQVQTLVVAMAIGMQAHVVVYVNLYFMVHVVNLKN